MSKINSLEALETLYGKAGQASLVKEIDYIHADYKRLIDASPFAALATVGPDGLDCSPRGDRAGQLVRVIDSKTLIMPDRRGNNRADSLKNIIRDPRVALMFLIPGHGNALRINGRASIDDDADLCASFAIDGQAPRSVIIIEVDAIYFQCARAIIRATLWDGSNAIDTSDLPTPGQILQNLSRSEIDGAAYDSEWPKRAAISMW